MGKYRYGLYLFHGLLLPLFIAIAALVPTGHPVAARALGVVFCFAVPFALTWLAAVLSYHLYEKRFLVLKDRLAPPTRCD